MAGIESVHEVASQEQRSCASKLHEPEKALKRARTAGIRNVGHAMRILGCGEQFADPAIALGFMLAARADRMTAEFLVECRLKGLEYLSTYAALAPGNVDMSENEEILVRVTIQHSHFAPSLIAAGLKQSRSKSSDIIEFRGKAVIPDELKDTIESVGGVIEFLRQPTRAQTNEIATDVNIGEPQRLPSRVEAKSAVETCAAPAAEDREGSPLYGDKKSGLKTRNSDSSSLPEVTPEPISDGRFQRLNRSSIDVHSQRKDWSIGMPHPNLLMMQAAFAENHERCDLELQPGGR